MKTVLTILTVIQAIGFLSSLYLAGGDLVAAFEDLKAGIYIIAVLWLIYAMVVAYKNKK